MSKGNDITKPNMDPSKMVIVWHEDEDTFMLYEDEDKAIYDSSEFDTLFYIREAQQLRVKRYEEPISQIDVNAFIN